MNLARTQEVNQAEDMVRDADGNPYHTVTVGQQIWLSQNLRTTRYRNGDEIPCIGDNIRWSSLETGAYCRYGNDIAHTEPYGLLYNWHAVSDIRGLAPEGFRVASSKDWDTLFSHLSSSGANTVTALAADFGWPASPLPGTPGHDPTGNNSTRFTALPGGFRDLSGGYGHLGRHGNWWTSDAQGTHYAWYRCLFAGYARWFQFNNHKNNGFSVRCVRDAGTMNPHSDATPYHHQ